MSNKRLYCNACVVGGKIISRGFAEKKMSREAPTEDKSLVGAIIESFLRSFFKRG